MMCRCRLRSGCFSGRKREAEPHGALERALSAMRTLGRDWVERAKRHAMKGSPGWRRWGGGSDKWQVTSGKFLAAAPS